MESTSKAASCLALMAALLFILLRKEGGESDGILRDKLDTVISSLLKYEANHGEAVHQPRVAVGYGACKDLFVTGAHMFTNISSNSGNLPAPAHFPSIATEEELVQMYAYFFKEGAAAERFVSDSDLFSSLVSQGLTDETHRWGLGGNAPVMAARFVKEGAKVLLGAKLSPGLAQWVPEGMTVAGGEIETDDVHLILEYKREEEWRGIKSPRANRFIVHHDLNNPLVSSLEQFSASLLAFQPELLVVGGLQMMDNFPFREGERLKRLGLIREQMAAMENGVKVHFEMASFVDNSLLVELAEHILPQANSLGMNEQELPNLHSLLTKGEVSVVSDSNPRIAVMLDMMREVYSILSVDKGDNRPLTRIHLHTLAYQAILTRKEGPWKKSGAAAVKASLTAHRHVCANTKVEPENSFLIMDDSFSTSQQPGAARVPFKDDRPLHCWDESDLDVTICLAPVLVCAHAVQTAGGGDNISAAGLAVQI